MNFTRRRIFYNEREFQSAWNPQGMGIRFWGGGREYDRNPRGALSDAGHFLGGALLNDGFRLFQNGGLPLIERRIGPLIEEILLRPSPYVRGEPFLPMRVSLHLSHVGLQQLRMRYWSPPSHAPSHLASLNLGQLELPPCWVIWNIGADHLALEELVEWVRRLALPWFERFESRAELRQGIFAMDIPYVEMDTAFELTIAEFGEHEGARFLDECVLPDSTFGPLVRSAAKQTRIGRGVVEIGGSPAMNLATIAAYHGFRI